MSIVDVVGRFVELKPVGRHLKGLCPFHEERTASFIVNPTSNNCFCYGCNKGGDSFQFISHLKGLDFLDSVRFVANLYNFTLDEEVAKVGVPRSRHVLECAFSLFRQALVCSDKALEYLHERGFDDDLIDSYELGFCSAEVVNKLKEEFSAEELIKCGLSNRPDSIAFYKRITFPLKDTRGQICGFSARFLPNLGMQDSVKYINSRDSDIFKKSLILANFSRAKPSIESKKQVIIAEGYFDVMALEVLGHSNGVCCVGCNFGQTHLDYLLALSKRLGQLEIIFCFDHDSAGKKALIRALILCFKQAYLNVGVLYFRHEKFKDLGDFIKAGLKPQLYKAEGFKFLCRRSFNPDYSAQQKDNNYKALFGLIKDYSPFLKLECQKIILSYVPKEVKQFINTAPLSKLDVNKLDVYFLEGRILRTMLEDQEFKYIVSRYLSGYDFPIMHPLYRAIFSGDTGCLNSLKRFILIDKQHWGTILESFKRNALNKSLAAAIKAKDTHLANALQDKLTKLVKPI